MLRRKLLAMAFCFSLFGTNAATAQQLKDTLNKLINLKEPIGYVENLLPLKGSKLRMDSISASYSANYIGDTAFNGLISSFSQYYAVGGKVYITELPFNLALSSNTSFHQNYQTLLSGLPKFNFDHEAYLSRLRAEVAEKIRPEDLLDLAKKRYDDIKQKYQAQLTKEIASLKHDFERTYDRVIDLKEGELTVDGSDKNQLINAVVPQEWRQRYNENKVRAEELAKLPSSETRDSLWRNSLSMVQEYQLRQDVAQKVLKARDAFNENIVVRELKEQLRFPENAFKDGLHDRSKLISLLKENASLNGLQKLFLNFTKLNIGANAVSRESMDLNHLVNNGIDAEFATKKFSVGAIHGSGSANRNLYGLQNASTFITNEYSRMSGVKVGTGASGRFYQSVSLNMFSFSQFDDFIATGPLKNQHHDIAGPARQDAVITYHADYTIKDKHLVKIDLGKSFGSYNNSLNNDSSEFGKQNLGNLFGNDGAQNWAAAVSYEGLLWNNDIGLGFQHAGLGYNNPGNFSVRRGESRLFWDFSRKVLNNKLSVRYRGDARNQVLDPSRIYVFNSFSSNLSFSYRIHRNNRISLQYRNVGNRLNNKALNSLTRGGNSMLQATAQFTSKLFRLPVTHVLLIGMQDMLIPVVNAASYKSSSMQFSYQQVIPVKQHTVTTNVTYNHSSNRDVLFNTTFLNAESLFGYPISKRITASSGVGYYDNASWNKQVGCRQQISVMGWKNIQFNVDISWRKAVVIENPVLANQFYGAASCFFKL